MLKNHIRAFARFASVAPAGLLLCAVAACAVAASPQAEALNALHALIGDAACSSDDQCRTVAIGNRACGGPDAYLAWSTQTTDAAALQAAVARYNALQAAEVPPGSRFSTCEFLADPGAACRPSAGGHRCQLVRGAPAPSR